MTRRDVLVLAAAVAIITAGCATRTAVAEPETPLDVAGRWSGEWTTPSGDRGTVDLRLDQNGFNVRGDLRFTGVLVPMGGPVEGRVGGNVLDLRQIGGTLTGNLALDGNRMYGVLIGDVVPRTVTLRRR
jgi:hypothetical protein